MPADTAKTHHSIPRRIRAITTGIIGALILAAGATVLFHYIRLEKAFAYWAATQTWSAEGIRTGCEAFTLGTGDVAVLLIHGFMGNPSEWRRTAEQLANNALTCRAMRLPGFGETLQGMRAHASLPVWQKAVDQEFEILSKNHRRIWVGGLSMGGALAVDFERRHPGRAAGLLLVAPAMRLREGGPSWLPRGLGRQPGLLSRLPLPSWPAILIDTNAPTACVAPIDRVATLSAMQAAQRAMESAYATDHISTPVWMAQATHDDVLDTAAGAVWLERTHAPVKVLEWIPKADHALLKTPAWAPILDKALAFMRHYP